MIERRDLLLVPFPFSDQSGRKVRPIIVISNNRYNQYHDDLVVVGVTSNLFNLTSSKSMYSAFVA